MLSLVFFLFASVSLAQWFQGGDMSEIPMYDCMGTCSPYRNTSNGPTQDALLIVQSNGMNTVRLRIWVNPAQADSYCNLYNVSLMATRLQKNNLKFYLDFHYSDTWADPAHQYKPAAWNNLSFSDLASQVYNYSKSTVQTLIKQGTPPAMIQVGNEIDNGMLWNSSGQSCSQGGYIWCGTGNNWNNFRELVAQGINGVRDGYRELNSPQPLIVIHIAKMNGGTAADVINWFQNLTNGTQTIDFDVIGLSYYEEYKSGPLSNLYSLSSVAAAFPTKKIMIAETDYPYQNAGWSGDFPQTETGQMEYLETMINIMKNGSVPNGFGVFYWGTEMYNDWPALFDSKAVALPALINSFR